MTTLDYRHELELRDQALRREIALRDQTFRRELDLRQQAFRDEQAQRDRTWQERTEGFEKQMDARCERIEKDVASIKADAKLVATEVQGLNLRLAKYFGGAIVVGAIASAALGAGLKHLLP